jgi:CRP/FNR family transcriptional activator FtrB
MEWEDIGPLARAWTPALPTGSPFAGLAGHVAEQGVRRGETLFEEGAPADLLYVVLDGVIALSGSGPRTTVIELARPVDCLELEAVLGGRRHLVTACALEPSRVLVAPAEDVRRQVAAEPDLARAMLDRLVAHGLRLTVQIKDLKLHGTTERLACWLLRLVAEEGPDDWARLSMSKGTLAQLLGMTAESLSRAFATLRSHGVEVHGSRVRILDRARLEAFCRCGASASG